MEHEPLVQGNYYHIFNRGNNRCNLFEQPAEYEHFLWLYDKYISPVAETLAWVLMRNHFHVLVYIKKDVVYKYTIETLNRTSPDKIWFEEHKWETVDLSELSEKLFDADRDFDADRSGDAVRSEERFDVDFDLSACAAFRFVGTSSDNVKSKEDNVKMENGNLKTPIPYRHFSHLFNAYSRYLQTRNGRTGNLFERPFKRKAIDTREYLKTVILYIHNNPVHHNFCSHPLEYPWTSYLTSISNKPTKLKRDEVIKLFSNKENFEQQHNQKIDVSEIEKWLEITPSDLHDFDLNLSKHGGEMYDADMSDADRACPGLSGSIDAVRSGKVVDLSACGAPDNVEIEDNAGSKLKVEGDNNIEKADNSENEKLNPDRSVMLSGSRNPRLSAFAEPDNANKMNGLIKENKIES